MTQPASRQAKAQRDTTLPLVKADGLSEQQSVDHPAQQHQVAFVADGAVLTQKAGQLAMAPDAEIPERLDSYKNTKLS
jgi:hypothetical protein